MSERGRDGQRLEAMELRRVRNGYMVMPWNFNAGQVNANNDIRVFETFESLMAWLKESFRHEGEKLREQT